MKNTKSVTIKFGTKFSTLLCLTFVVLKLTQVITWSWFWILLPLIWWIILLIIVGFIAGILYIVSKFAIWLSEKTINFKNKFDPMRKHYKEINENLPPPWVK